MQRLLVLLGLFVLLFGVAESGICNAVMDRSGSRRIAECHNTAGSAVLAFTFLTPLNPKSDSLTCDPPTSTKKLTSLPTTQTGVMFEVPDPDLPASLNRHACCFGYKPTASQKQTVTCSFSSLPGRAPVSGAAPPAGALQPQTLPSATGTRKPTTAAAVTHDAPYDGHQEQLQQQAQLAKPSQGLVDAIKRLEDRKQSVLLVEKASNQLLEQSKAVGSLVEQLSEEVDLLGKGRQDMKQVVEQLDSAMKTAVVVLQRQRKVRTLLLGMALSHAIPAAAVAGLGAAVGSAIGTLIGSAADKISGDLPEHLVSKVSVEEKAREKAVSTVLGDGFSKVTNVAGGSAYVGFLSAAKDAEASYAKLQEKVSKTQADFEAVKSKMDTARARQIFIQLQSVAADMFALQNETIGMLQKLLANLHKGSAPATVVKKVQDTALDQLIYARERDIN